MITTRRAAAAAAAAAAAGNNPPPAAAADAKLIAGVKGGGGAPPAAAPRRALGDITNANGTIGGGRRGPAAAGGGVKKGTTSLVGVAPVGGGGGAVGNKRKTRSTRTSAEADKVAMAGAAAAAAVAPASTAVAAAPKGLAAPVPAPLPAMDLADLGNPLTAAEYAVEIHANALARERRFMPPPTYMAVVQTDVTPKMRAILVDWLVDVALKFKLSGETLWLTVNVIDRFLSKRPVIRQRLQLVGVTSMLIAAKYQEIYAPETRDFVYISDKAYAEEEILALEAVILNTLRFEVTVPSALSFAARLLKAVGAPGGSRVAAATAYTLELAMQDYSLLPWSPSELAAGAVLLARTDALAAGLGAAPGSSAAAAAAAAAVAGPTPWCAGLAEHAASTGPATAAAVAAALKQLVRADAAANNKLTAVKRKYASSKYGGVSSRLAAEAAAEAAAAAASVAAVDPAGPSGYHPGGGVPVPLGGVRGGAVAAAAAAAAAATAATAAATYEEEAYEEDYEDEYDEEEDDEAMDVDY
ncbi:hypothetical protein MMPV_002804 [Pyropia vietnamensis]